MFSDIRFKMVLFQNLLIDKLTHFVYKVKIVHAFERITLSINESTKNSYVGENKKVKIIQ